MSPAPDPPPSLAPKAFLGKGLLGILHVLRGNLAFLDAAGLLRSMGSLPCLEQTSVFYIVFNVGIFHKTEIISYSQLQSVLPDCSPEDLPLQTCILTLKYLPQFFQTKT